MANKFSKLRGKMPSEAQAKASQLAQRYDREMALDQLREAMSMTQQHLAQVLKTSQANISKLERRTDMYLSTLQSVIRALGGELRVTAVFSDRSVVINQFQDVGGATAPLKRVKASRR
jgi:transcriptional regulator with XRE-family HTH domain